MKCGAAIDTLWAQRVSTETVHHADDRDRRGPIGGRMATVLLVCRCTDCSRCHIPNNCYFLSALSPYRSVLVARCDVIYKCTKLIVQRNDDRFPAYFQLSRPRERRGENLALGVHASAASSRERVGLASLRWRSRRPRRSLENAQFHSRFPE